MNVQTLAAEVVTELRQPHAVAEITSAVRKAVTAAHNSGEYAKDLVEEVVNLGQVSNSFKFGLPPFCRKLKLVKPCSTDGQVMTLYTESGGFDKIAPGDVMTVAGNAMTNFYYIIGPTVVLRTSAALQYVYMMYYSKPDLRTLESSTWIMRDYPELVKDLAKAMYYATKSDREKEASYRNLYQEQVMAMFDNEV